MDSRSIKGVKHLVFTDKKEYYSHFGKSAPAPVEDWREGEEKDWVVGDDGGVVQLLKVSHSIKHPNDRKNYKLSKGWCRTVVGIKSLWILTLKNTQTVIHSRRR